MHKLFDIVKLFTKINKTENMLYLNKYRQVCNYIKIYINNYINVLIESYNNINKNINIIETKNTIKNHILNNVVLLIYNIKINNIYIFNMHT